MSEPAFVQRFLLAWSTFFRILFDAGFAARLLAEPEALSLKERAEPQPPPPPAREPQVAPAPPPGPSAEQGALQLLSLLQREGRFVDFIQQDVTRFGDAEIGQAARVVHAGCRSALARTLQVEPVLDQAEGSSTSVPRGFEPAAIKLVGAVSGDAPYRGTLRHKGWRAKRLSLPETLADHAFDILAPAEVEL